MSSEKLDPDQQRLRESHRKMKRKNPPSENGSSEPTLNYQIQRNIELVEFLETLNPNMRKTWLQAQTYRPETITRFLDAIKAREIIRSESSTQKGNEIKEVK